MWKIFTENHIIHCSAERHREEEWRSSSDESDRILFFILFLNHFLHLLTTFAYGCRSGSLWYETVDTVGIR